MVAPVIGGADAADVPTEVVSGFGLHLESESSPPEDTRGPKPLGAAFLIVACLLQTGDLSSS